MKPYRTGLWVFLWSFLIIATSCGPSVVVTGEWRNPDEQPTTDYDKLMVTAMVSNEEAKRAIENEIESQLGQKNIASTKGYVLFPAMFSDKFEKDKEEVLRKIREAGNDAILTISVLDQDTETRFIPGTRTYAPLNVYGWYGRFWGYYNYYYPFMYDPGYYSTTNVYYIEANLYDAKSEKLMWSAQTETYNPNQLEYFASDLAKTIVRELTENGLL